MQHAGGDGGVGFAVDQDEAAQRAAGFVGLPDDGLGGGERDDADAVQGQRLGGEVLGGVDVDLVFERLDGGADGPGAGFEPVGAAGQERVGGHPDERCLELVGGFGRVGGGGDDVAAAAVDLVGERERDGLAGHGLGQVAVEGDDAGDGGGLAGGDDADGVARADGAGGDQAGEAAVVGIGAVDPLDGQAEGLGLVGDLVELDAFEMGQQGGAAVPGHVGRQGGDVVAAQAREGDGGEGADADRGGEDAEILDDRVERVAAVAGEVHLVDGQHEVADAEQVAEIGVPPGPGRGCPCGRRRAGRRGRRWTRR